MLRVEQVSKTFAGRLVLAPTDLAFATGQTTVLLGQSGSGKSTLLKMLMGLVWPDTGRVIVDGEELTPANVRTVRRRMGYVIQEGGLFPHLTARANVLLAPRFLRREGEALSYLPEALAAVRLAPEILDRYPAQLSGGQRQRVSLLRALILKPRILLLDEPMGALDPLIRADLQSDLKAACRDLGQTVVLVTHDVGEAAYLGDEIVMLSGGRIVQQGPIDELLADPRDPFVRSFLTAPRTLPPLRRAAAVPSETVLS